MTAARTADHPINPLFLERWSPRAYDASSMPKADLLSVLEAARWAPSAYNVQPWRFLYAHRDDTNWPMFVNLLDPFNASWAHTASVLVIVVSDSIMPGDNTRPNKASHYNSFDTGAAWAQMALQASAMGYKAHAMAGVLFEKARKSLHVPERYKIEIAVALGKHTEASILPDAMREQEQPSGRIPLNELAFEGLFPA